MSELKALLLITELIEMEILKSAKMVVVKRLPKRLARISVKTLSISRVILVPKNVNISQEGIDNILLVEKSHCLCKRCRQLRKRDFWLKREKT